MKKLFLAVVLMAVLFASLASAHHVNGTDEDEETCGAPASWEVHKTTSEVLLEVAAIVLGVIGARLGMKKKNKKMLAGGILLVLIGAGAFLAGAPYQQELINFGVAGSTHEHADFAVFINGVQQNFSQEKYMSDGGVPKSGLTHLHGGVGTVMHKHATGVTFTYLLKTLGWQLNNSCLATDTSRTYCKSRKYANEVALFVNGKRIGDIETYSPRDLDKILLFATYPGLFNGDDESLAARYKTTNLSCVYSLKCPAPSGISLPQENCVS